MRRQDWVAATLKEHQSLCSRKRRLSQTKTSPDFVTGEELDGLDCRLIQSDMMYVCSRPLPRHMGGPPRRRRSERVIRKELIDDQNKILQMMLDHPLASNISNMMRKFPLGSLFFQQKPTVPTPATATPRPPRTQPNIATPTPVVRTTATTTPDTTTPTPPAPVTDAQRYVTPTVPPQRTKPSTTPRPRMTAYHQNGEDRYSSRLNFWALHPSG